VKKQQHLLGTGMHQLSETRKNEWHQPHTGSKEPVLSKEQDAHLVFLSGIVLHCNVYEV